MSIRQFVAAALMASACAAHADVIPSPSTASSPSTFLSGWTTGNGTDIMSSGVMSKNVNLIGGVAYGSAASADALFNKASDSLGAAADSTKLYYTKGIEGMYLLGAGHGLLAAMLGNGVSVVGANGGVVVTQGTEAGKTSTSTQTGGMSSPPANSSPSTGDSTPSSSPSPGASTGGDSPTDATVRPDASESFPPNNQGQLELPGGAAPLATVPEPSTIALMLAGLLGAGSLTRRRNR
jgi:hypothetical protein